MMHWKILKFLAAISAAVLFFYQSAFDPLRKLLFAKYDLRWSVKEEKQERIQTIAFRNSGSEPSEAIQIEIEFPQGAVADFEGGDFAGGPRVSFLQAVARTPYGTRVLHANKTQLMRLLDEHYPLRSLFQLEDSFRANLVADIRKSGHSAADTDIFLRLQASHHETQILGCGSANERKPSCEMEQQLEQWEYEMQGFREEACRAWGAATGISVNFAQGYLGPKGKTTFSLLLRGRESKFLTIHYGADEIPPLKIATSQEQESIKVAAADLEASRWKIVPWYTPINTFVALFILLALLWLAWAMHTSPRKLSTLELFNLALRTLSPEAWNLARERRDHWVEREFHFYCTIFGKANLGESRARLFQYVQDRLVRDYSLYDLQFESKEELEKTMRKYLRHLAMHS